jgi:hypothetical protein
LAVLLCLDMCNIIDISKGNFTVYEWSMISRDEYLNSIFIYMLWYLGYIVLSLFPQDCADLFFSQF